jgi:hypothetical protein
MPNFPMAAQIAPFRRLVPITASSSAFAETRGVLIEAAGDFTVVFADDPTEVTLTLVAGQVYPFCIVKCTAGTGLCAGY